MDIDLKGVTDYYGYWFKRLTDFYGYWFKKDKRIIMDIDL